MQLVTPLARTRTHQKRLSRTRRHTARIFYYQLRSFSSDLVSTNACAQLSQASFVHSESPCEWPHWRNASVFPSNLVPQGLKRQATPLRFKRSARLVLAEQCSLRRNRVTRGPATFRIRCFVLIVALFGRPVAVSGSARTRVARTKRPPQVLQSLKSNSAYISRPTLYWFVMRLSAEPPFDRYSVSDDLARQACQFIRIIGVAFLAGFLGQSE